MTEIEIKSNFSKNIKELRLSKKLNQIQLGEKIHYSSKAISKWENGDVMPDIFTLKMLADFFNINVDDLISNKNVVRKSHRRLNRILITSSSALLSFVVAAIMFMILYLCNVPGSWRAFPVGAFGAAITVTVFAALWYKRIVLIISSAFIVVFLTLMIMTFMDAAYFWTILIVGVLLLAGTVIFLNIRFTDRK